LRGFWGHLEILSHVPGVKEVCKSQGVTAEPARLPGVCLLGLGSVYMGWPENEADLYRSGAIY
jgi:hypothetical protein